MKGVFAVVAVAVAFASQLLLVFFLLDISPVGINAGDALPLLPALVINAALLALFALPHSVMARPAFKQRWNRLISPSLDRAAYLLVSGVLLSILCLAWQPLPGTIWQVDHELASTAIRVVFFSGLALVAWSIVSIDALHFHGLRQAFGQRWEPPFLVRGPYRWVRHPIQTGLIVALWATPELTIGHAMFAGVLSLYSVIATIKLEERDLLRSIGGPYERYREEVPALVPLLRRRR